MAMGINTQGQRLEQRFPTWSTRTPRDTFAHLNGYIYCTPQQINFET